jgi:hypothetical protein
MPPVRAAQARLEEQLGRDASLVLGDTDSERYFALITQRADARGGDVGAGMTAAARWIAANLPVSSLNTVVAALRHLHHCLGGGWIYRGCSSR